MEEMDDQVKVSRSLPYDNPDSAAVFRIAWHLVTREPGFILSEHSEAESTIFKGKALFTGRIEDHPVTTRVWVEEAQRSIGITAFGDDEPLLAGYVDGLVEELKRDLDTFRDFDEDMKARVRRALIARTCWDRIVHHVLNKTPASTIYFQVAHGREMIIKATEGDEPHPIALATNTWLTKLESFPDGEALPGDFATELAKKSVEWKKQTVELIHEFFNK